MKSLLAAGDEFELLVVSCMLRASPADVFPVNYSQLALAVIADGHGREKGERYKK